MTTTLAGLVARLVEELLPYSKRLVVEPLSDNRAEIRVTCRALVLECKTVVHRIQRGLRDATIYTEHTGPGGLRLEAVI